MNFTAGEVEVYYSARVPHLKQTGAWRRGPCPIHNGQRDSFAVETETGLWRCHSQCDRGGDILALEQELTGADFPTAKVEVFRIVGRAETPNGNHQRESARRRIVATYDYKDEAGRLLFQVVRTHPKGFYQRGPNGERSIKGVRLVLYRLPELLNRSGETVYVVEGCKDVHSLEALGLLATCNPMGAGKWKADYSETLRGRSVVILFDNDPPTDEHGKPHYKGQRHAATVAADLLRVGCEVRIVELPNSHDASDWIAAGGTLQDLQALVGGQPALTTEGLKAWSARWKLDAEPNKATEAGRKLKARPESRVFKLTEDAVLYEDPDPDKEPLTICGRLEVAAFTRGANGDGWGRLLKWPDSEGRAHEWAMPMSLLAGDGSECRARLLDGGLYIAPGRKAKDFLAVYLQTARTEKRALCVARVGWSGNKFVLPGATIGQDGGEIVLFQTPYESDHLFNTAGTLEDWRANVGRLCSGNSRLILAASCAFAGPLLSLVGCESGGVHFHGATSTGKSTALLVGGSVLGGGGRNGFVQSWRATANGLEAIAELHNDLCLFLDELAQLDPKEAAETAYLLGNGSGKTRMSRNIGARKKLSWALLFVSAGEITLADHAQTVGKHTRGGAEVRLLNIEADAGAGLGLFENIHGSESADAFARQLKDAARRFYGAPLRAYLDFITRKQAAIQKIIKDFQAGFLKEHLPTGASGEVCRAAQRFALIAAAGELATGAEITGWKEGESTEAAARCLESWITGRGTTGSGDKEAAVRQVRAFIEANGSSRFQHNDAANEQIVRERAGFKRKNGDGGTEYLILPEVFKREVCKGFDYRMVARALEERGYLYRQLPELVIKTTVPELGPARVFLVKASIVEG